MGFLDWVGFGLDVANTAANINNAVNIHKLNERAENAATVQMYITAFTNAIDECADKVNQLMPLANDHPLPVYTLTKVLQLRCEENGVSYQTYQVLENAINLSDRRIIKETFSRMKNLIAGTRALLSDAEIMDGDECAMALMYMPLLDTAITTQTAIEQVQEIDAEKNRYSSEYNLAPTVLNKKKRNWGLTLLLAGIIASAVFCVFPSLAGLIVNKLPYGSIKQIMTTVIAISTLLGVLIVIGGIIAAIIGLVLLLTSSKKSVQMNPKYNELVNQRNMAIRGIADNDTRQKILKIFGQKTSEEYRYLKEKWELLVKRVMGIFDEDMNPRSVSNHPKQLASTSGPADLSDYGS